MNNIYLQGSSEDEFMKKLCAMLIEKLHEFVTKKEPEDDLITREKAAKMLDISLMTLYNWTESGYFTPVRIGRRIYYRKSDILKTLN